MGFDIQQTSVDFEIRGKTYAAQVDNPTFVDWVQKQTGRELSGAEEMVTFTGELVVSLLGVEAAQEIFEGFPASLTQYTALLGYIVVTIRESGAGDLLEDIASSYSLHEIL